MKCAISPQNKLHLEMGHASQHELVLYPESEADQRVCEKLIAGYRLIGMGRCGISERVLHVRIELSESEEGDG